MALITMRRIVFSLAWLVLLTSWSARAAVMEVWTWEIGPGIEIWQEDRDEQREPRLPWQIYALDCPEIDQVFSNRPFLLRCAVARQLPVTRIYLRYRASWTDAYLQIEMQKTVKGWYQARIPRAALSGPSIQFYFEGRDAHGEPVVRNGTYDKPNVTLVVHLPPRCPEWECPPSPADPRDEDLDSGRRPIAGH
jgi:hypothetical protein